jgi:two-component system response regulator QseB
MAAKRRILVVEADPLVRLGLEYVLQREGFESLAVSTLQHALANLADIDAVVIDPVLPDGNGVELLRQIRASSMPIAVAVLSANSRLRKAAQTAGAAIVFEKPVSREKLDALLAWLKSLPSKPPVP